MSEIPQTSFASRFMRVFLPLITGFFITNIVRTTTAVFAGPIESDLNITQTFMGLTSSIFYLAYAFMQVPVGVLTDHIGPRKTQCLLFLLAGLGSIVFGLAPSGSILLLGRIMLGFGLAGALMISFIANRLWFCEKQVPILNSISFAVGSSGSIVASVPLASLMHKVSWQTISIWIGLITIAVAFIILFVVPKSPKREHHVTFMSQLKGLKWVYTNRYFWKIAPLTIFSVASLLTIQTYWIAPWLRHTLDIDMKLAAHYLLLMGVGFTLAMPTASFLSHLLRRYKGEMEWMAGLGSLIAIISQTLIVSGVFPGSMSLWFLFAFFGMFPMLGYTLLSIHFTKCFSGRVSTALNLLVFAGVFILQYLFGIVATFGLEASFWLLIGLQTLSLVWFCIGQVGENVRG